MDKFKKGDKVEVTECGCVYTNYAQFAKLVKAKNWKDGNNCLNRDKGIVLVVRKHIDDDTNVALIKIGNKEVIIGVDGLDLIKRGKKVKESKVNFLLQYELDEDPVEEFETMPQVRKRIKELVDTKDSLKRDSIKVWEVKNVKNVILGTSITIK